MGPRTCASPAPLVQRRHVDLLRVASSLCRHR
ncbi:putative leader peptide [Prauserella rugosa]